MTTLEVVSSVAKVPSIHSASESSTLEDRKQELIQELTQYQEKTQKELSAYRKINRWSIGLGLALSTACTISTAYEDTQDLTLILGTLSVTFHSWIASVPMSKKTALYERVLVKSDNLHSDLRFAAEDLADLEMIRDQFKALKVEMIETNTQSTIPHKLHSQTE
ncbi:MAG: hypothetical protein WBA77_08360 [Microcoleaceae cyanobacterium]